MCTNAKSRLVVFVVSIVWVFGTCAFGLSGFLLIAPLALVVLALVRPFRAPALGLLTGWLLWFYDHDFGVNVGGPEAPMSRAIRDWLGLRWDNDTAPVLLLMAAGGCVALAYQLVRRAVLRAGTNHVQ